MTADLRRFPRSVVLDVARWTFRNMQPEEAEETATELLVAGFETPELIRLADMVDGDADEMRPLFEKILDQLDLRIDELTALTVVTLPLLRRVVAQDGDWVESARQAGRLVYERSDRWRVGVERFSDWYYLEHLAETIEDLADLQKQRRLDERAAQIERLRAELLAFARDFIARHGDLLTRE